MSGFEIERKFLVRGEDFKQQAESSSYIKQGYILSGGGRTVRVRIRDEKGFLTIKGPSRNGGLSRYEFEKEITLDEAEHLMALCEPGVVEKRRYIVPFRDHVFEVDEFFGDNDGLVFAEVELNDENESFEKPEFIGTEVTGDRRFYNSHLRRFPYLLWRATMPEEYRHTRQE
ncbi:CYTH domain-containing protein [Prevotella koreensis]|uniref:CYTH domain-containing protein n=1 Tax=Prevotella koreensis TaxID=2490854 RepID=A0A432LLT1_9BACT|nr:CYTH domain-containing protein [Prevotella koreensis]RUL59797.1 CYTH domain-containing protein [Prevotella koreensis]